MKIIDSDQLASLEASLSGHDFLKIINPLLKIIDADQLEASLSGHDFLKIIYPLLKIIDSDQLASLEASLSGFILFHPHDETI